jgi:exosome complex RNA-binding protein Rrp42 (RNase PH superfamily)
MDGDPLDICSIAAYVALNCTKVPKVELCAGTSGSMESFEVCGDLGDGYAINTDGVPVCVTMVKVSKLKF